MLTLLAVAEGEAESLELLPAVPELIWGAVAFFLMMLFIVKYVFPKANQVLEDRSAAIVGKMEAADRKLQEAEASKAEFDAQIADARGEAARIVDEAKQTAEQLRANIIAKAEDEAAALLDKARADVDAERDRLLQELRAQVGVISVDLAGRIVERELDPGTHQALVDDYIQNLSRAN
ncbi:MAG: F0F1 ATP synthase subunit B [Nitriliruptor sp.]|uniref:F0F1 ATP synthase subunit B n=1 Tax=Nitriliruptor sp. TaxID=2448056 RepID=UPI00349FD31C